MAVRIYSLAKDVGLDSKELVDLCARLGIQNKGSALASLEDDEIAKIKKHLDEKSSATAAPPPPPKPAREPLKEAPIRDLSGKLGGAKRDLSSGRRATVGTGVSTDARGDAEYPAEDVSTTEQPVAPSESEDIASEPAPAMVAESSPTAAPIEDVEIDMPAESDAVSEKELAESSKSSTPGPLRRDDYYAPAQTSGKVRVLGRQRPAAPSADGSKPSADRPDRAKRSREPVLNLARIPKSATPPPSAKPQEQATQKPIVKLTPDVIQGVKKGMEKPTEKQPLPGKQTGTGAGSNRASTPSQAMHAGLADFKANAENKLNLKNKKAADEEEAKAQLKKKGFNDGRSDRLRTKIHSSKDLALIEEEENKRRGNKGARIKKQHTIARKEKAILELPCSVRSFSEAAGVPAARVLRSLMMMGTMANINSTLAQEQAEMVAADIGVDIEFKRAESLETSLINKLEAVEDNPEDLVARPPIVTFLGHVDHGKTSLLDYLIGTKIVTGEAGGITQHIRAYQVKKDGRAVAFVDTPGHEAFTEMRARGANVTDIAILVVALDDGIMPQTEEAISHAKAAGVPIVVAANKCDLPGADLNRLMTQMTEHGLTPSAWGGDVEVVETSAITGKGMDELLETVLTVAELHEYRANPKRAAAGVCLESEQASDRGVIAKVMVQNGTLRVGDIVVCGSTFGRVKALYDTLKRNKQLTEAGPSMPVNITGLDKAPEAGEKFFVLDDIGQARQLAADRENALRAQNLSGTSPKVSFETFQELLQTGKLGVKEEKVVLNLIIRADARGSLEAIEKELTKLDHPEVEIKILQKSVGGITVADVTLASASQAVIVGFNVIPDEAARGLADDRNVEIRRYDIIYNLALDIKALIEGRLKPEERVVELGRALVKQVFAVSRVGTIAGCYVAQGTIERGCRVRVNREGRKIGDYALDTLKRHKDDVKEVPRGMECGIRLGGFNDIKVDDILEAYRIEEVARKLETSRI
ncbi:Translation initiation factor IF-2 [Pirellula sp. SH-Sr6A]|uniref:translation initiation factor IF-2 n=1 Tax=Pirellula sp. SH-Sr6A TaxID=1632865 RepID=UPI00078E798E|nr:translation initiation factor IF-2 [Pirellula sp. SH-Sr6A]AMV33047.1 Translation initiation factor IF-2 [Pirellula sp. SH-Sr6A]